jgi:hypothetical protein
MHPLMILVAGPYRSGTNDESGPHRQKRGGDDRNLASALPRRPSARDGRVVCPTLIEHTASTGIGDPVFNEIFPRFRADSSPSVMAAFVSVAHLRALTKCLPYSNNTERLCSTL